MTFIIAGGKGQLGLALQRRFSEKGVAFRALNHQELDITSQDSIARLSNRQPTDIINCAAWTNVDGAESNIERARLVNRDGVKNLSKFSKGLHIPFLHISTDYVFAGDQNEPLRINAPTNPESIYGKTKLEGEQEVLSAYPEGSYIIRTAWLYSPWRKNFAKTMTKRALTNSPSRVVSDQFGQPTSALDLANQILLILERKPKVGTYHGTNSGIASWFDFAQEIYHLSKADTALVSPIPTSEFDTPAIRPKYSVLDHSTWQEVGLEPMREWKTALKSVFVEIRREVERELEDG